MMFSASIFLRLIQDIGTQRLRDIAALPGSDPRARRRAVAVLGFEAIGRTAANCHPGIQQLRCYATNELVRRFAFSWLP